MHVRKLRATTPVGQQQARAALEELRSVELTPEEEEILDIDSRPSARSIPSIFPASLMRTDETPARNLAGLLLDDWTQPGPSPRA